MKFKLKPFENAIQITHIANIHCFEFAKQIHTQKVPPFPQAHLQRCGIYHRQS